MDTPQNNPEETSQEVACDPPADNETVERYRALHGAMMLSQGNYQAMVALAGVSMARAQGRIKHGVHARRQTLLAMAQALHSAGIRARRGTLGLMFAEMARAGVFKITRKEGGGKNGIIVDVELVRDCRRELRHQPPTDDFTLEWSDKDVETFPALAMSWTPRENETHRPISLVAKEVVTCQTPKRQRAEERRALDAEAEVAVQSGQHRSPTQVRSYWANEGGEVFDAFG